MNDARRPFPPSWARTLGLVFAGWTVYAALQANVIFSLRAMNPQPGVPPVSWLNLFRYSLPEAWLWALLTLPVVSAARRLPVTAANWWHRLPLHFGLAALVHVTIATVLWAIHPLVRYGPRPEMPRTLVGGILFDTFIYAAIAATWYAVAAHGQALRLKNALLESELRMLRMQLQPHFLFNTLNAVSELIHRDPPRAERALARLGELLRWSLQSSSLKEVSLREELAALELYLDIQRLRHGDGLVLRVDAEPAALDVAVPSLLLQPLVENAIRHGVRGSASGTGSVAVDVRRENGILRFRVEDDGRGLAPDFQEGTGLRTTRARLAGLYGDEHALRLDRGTAGGTCVEVTIPARPLAETGMIDVLIVDDEPMARARLRRLIEATPDLRIRAECVSGEEALAAIDLHLPHAVFLDVDMPGLTGFDVVEALPTDRRPLVVFVTAYDEFAVRAFEVHALDYLLKPYDPERFAATLERLRERLASGSHDASAFAALLEQVRGHGPERLVVRSGHDLVFVPVRDIDWIGSADNYVELHVGAQVHLLRETLSNVERRLSPASFARIRRDAIVNLERVRRVRPREDGDFELVLHDGRSLRLGRTYRARVTERWQGA